ncbi:MAG: hypothetical protein Q4D56_13085 [Bacteroides sp.]|nr:hypothetical protein [Bacteroides sp.]
MSNQEILSSAIQDYEKGGLLNEAFLSKAHSIYNEYATFPSPLPNAEHPYLLGIVFSYFAKYYSKNIDYYTCIMENALFCFFKVMSTSLSQSECQCAAMRVLLLIEDNDWVMKGIAHKFYEQRCQELYGQPLMVQSFLARGMEPWTFETDILRQIGYYCIKKSSSDGKQSMISSSDTERFKSIVKSGKYNVTWPLVTVSPDRVYELFFKFISGYIGTPYERRITQLRYNW